ncbi:hypothetical protein [Embleya hyalina]|uniref:Uncharacterized protein n=1 Tax=Embleya hyalina TaxID=516124 RepID=A0A401YX80_9ACTN|nr:hypothetical protein [Embleya hyalina]GCD99213.1 hypothetical protein EHYA_06926 [Embleya hyalina]
MTTPRARPYVPQHPLFVPNETFRPFTPLAHSVTASCVAHPTTPVVLTWRFNVFDATGLPMVLTEPRHPTRPQALTLLRHLRDSLVGASFTPDELGGAA